MNQSNVNTPIILPSDPKQKSTSSTKEQQAQEVLYQLFIEKLMMGCSATEAGRAVGYSPSVLKQILLLPEVKEIIKTREKYMKPSKNEMIYKYCGMLNSSILDICDIDGDGRLILKPLDSISPLALAMLKSVKISEGKITVITLANTAKIMSRLMKLVNLKAV